TSRPTQPPVEREPPVRSSVRWRPRQPPDLTAALATAKKASRASTVAPETSKGRGPQVEPDGDPASSGKPASDEDMARLRQLIAATAEDDSQKPDLYLRLADMLAVKFRRSGD